ncbi:hypothetical protein AC579_4692 [Pseudocercospora musae]|uniref:Arrestin-like N-terminal domain-containing protein n=1 Tax=Pseudocercospora musae TaxID=113226 RepID=A0A139IBA5_9PEZI|nr:hypothetical protein AC579_4692 [Pseudocercospora musae]
MLPPVHNDITSPHEINQNMTKLKLGSLQAEICIDQEKPLYRDPDDPYAGKILLRYGAHKNVLRREQPESTAELFGPLELDIVMRGYIDLRVCTHQGIWSNSCMDLFSYRHSLYTGPFRAKVGQVHCFPFSVNKLEPPANFPPTFQCVFHNDPYDIKMAVKCELTAEVRLPGLRIRAADAEAKEIEYVPEPLLGSFPKVESSFYKQRVVIQSRKLLRWHERPHGLVRWYRHHLKSIPYPKLEFHVLCSTRRTHMHTGRNPEFDLIIKPTAIDSVTLNTPITLEYFSVKLNAITKVDARNVRTCGSKFFQHSLAVQNFRLFSYLPLEFSPQDLSTTHQYITRILTSSIKGENLPSFEHDKVSRRYEYKVHMTFKVAGQYAEVRLRIPITIVAPPPIGLNEMEDKQCAQSELEFAPPTYQKYVRLGEAELPEYTASEPRSEMSGRSEWSGGPHLADMHALGARSSQLFPNHRAH